MKLYLIAFLLLFVSFNSLANQPTAIPSNPESNITIDGTISDGEWDGAFSTKLAFETWPGDNVKIEPKYQTTIKLLSDKRSLKIAVIAKDPEPHNIISTYYKRDNMNNDDYIEIKIDPSSQAHEAYIFKVNPLGGQEDYISLGRSSSSWDGLWTSEGKVTNNGFTIEIELPFSNFRYDDNQDQNWSIQILRHFKRDQKYSHSLVEYDRRNDCQLCQMRRFTLDELPRSASSLVRGYIKGSQNRTATTSDLNQFDSSTAKDIGLDVKYSALPGQVINAVINPDFSQIEADNFQFEANTNFSIYYPEKRIFFLEGENYFNTPLNLVHTRNISTPNYGVKYTGMSDSHYLGVFYVSDSETNILLPGRFSSEITTLEEDSSNVALRYKYQFDRKGHAGISVTNRDSKSYNNSVVSFDGFYRINDKARFSAQLARSDNTLYDENQDGNAIKLDYMYNDSEDWHWLSYSEYDNEFNGGMSFIRKNGYRSLTGGLGYLWNYKEGYFTRFLTTLNNHIEKSTIEEEGTSDLLVKTHQLQGILYGKNGLELNARLTKTKELYAQQHFNYDRYLLSVKSDFLRTNTVQGWTYHGQTIDYWHARDAKLDEYGLSTTFNFSPQLSLVFLRKQRDVYADNEHLFQTLITRTSLEYSYNFKHHFRLKAQISENTFNKDNFSFELSQKDNVAGFQFLYVYQPSSYTSIYAGYSSNFVENDSIGKLKEFNNYAFIKLNYSWSL